MSFLTVKLVDDFAAHLKLFGLATEQCQKFNEEGNNKGDFKPIRSYFVELRRTILLWLLFHGLLIKIISLIYKLNNFSR